MSRNRYEEAFGVLRLRWKYDVPSEHTHGLILVEVWQSGLESWNAMLPKVEVDARFEVRVRVNGEWRALDHYGALTKPREGMVRRWAHLHATRTWHGNLKIEGWDKQ